MALRTLVTDGVTWNVWDVYPSSDGRLRLTYAESFEAGWLVFASESERRRVAPIPPQWEEWPDEELQHALQNAAPVRRPARVAVPADEAA